MKAKKHFLFLTLFIVLFSHLFVLFGIGNNYSLQFATGDEFIWEVTTVDEEGLEEAFGSAWKNRMGIKQYLGVQDKAVISIIEEKEQYWEVSYQFWFYTLSSFSEEPQVVIPLTLFKDPFEHSQDYQAIEGYRFLPIPVNSFLSDAFGNISYYTIVDNSLKFRIDEYSIFENRIWDTNSGVLSSIQFLYLNEVIWEQSLTTGLSVPSYSILALSGTVALSSLGIAYIVREKFRIKN